MAMGYLPKRDHRSELFGELQQASHRQQVKKDSNPRDDRNCPVKETVSLSKGSRQRSLRQRSNSATAPVVATSSTDVRSRFLNRLGIQKQDRQQKQALRVKEEEDLRPKAEPVQETLKGDYGARDESLLDGSFSSISTASLMTCSISSSSFSSNSSTSSGSRRSVSFGTTVEVLPIPNHKAYSDRVRQSYWTSSNEMRVNAARNCFEFAAESFDWKRAAEEKDMVLYQGELVHPVHFVHQVSLRQHFSPCTSIHSTSN